jgi:catechol 2,3-dioxygenase-like lactoylglutathione lyase family enzyme
MAPTFHAIGLTAADMAESLAFYRLLGLDFPAGAEKAPHAEAELPGGLRLMVDTHETILSFDPDFTPGTGPSGGSLAFLCADPAEVDSTYARLIEAGHRSHKEPWDADWGQRYAIVYDPDGTEVGLFAPLAT